MTRCYLLPCSCGRELSVQPPQAGEQIRCTCGASLQVPTMLEMKQLVPVPDEAEPLGQRPAAAWGARQGMFFGGVVVLAVSLVLGIVVVATRPVPPEKIVDPGFIRQETQKLTPMQAWRIWGTLRTAGLDRSIGEARRQYAERVLQYRGWIAVVVIVALAGVALIVLPVVIRKRSTASGARI